MRLVRLAQLAPAGRPDAVHVRTIPNTSSRFFASLSRLTGPAGSVRTGMTGRMRGIISFEIGRGTGICFWMESPRGTKAR